MREATLVDSHCHLDSPRFDADRALVLERARAAGVGGIVNIGCDLATSVRSLGLAAMHPDVWATVGVHPHEAKDAPAGFDDELINPLLPHCNSVPFSASPLMHLGLTENCAKATDPVTQVDLSFTLFGGEGRA